MQNILHILEGLIFKDDVVIVGFSGGPDSTFLLHLLLNLEKKQKFSIIAAHINYHLRGVDSEQDEIFAKSFCEKYKIPLHIKSVKYKKKYGNLENWARKIRYGFFFELAKKYHTKKIFIAHNLDDLIETFFLKLIKKSDPFSLYNTDIITIQNDFYIYRPLISIEKREILNYLQTNNISFRMDKSNLNNDFNRNFLRNETLTQMKNRFPEFFKNFFEIYQRQQFINKKFFEYQLKVFQVIAKKDENIIKIPILNNISPYEMFHFVKLALIDLGYNKALKSEYYQNFKNILEKNGGKYLKLSKKYYIFKGYEYLYVYNEKDMKKYEYELLFNKIGEYEIHIPFYTFKMKLKKNKSIFVRPYKRGDFSMINGEKKLISKYLKKLNIDHLIRKYYPVFIYNKNIVALGNIKVFDSKINTILEVK